MAEKTTRVDHLTNVAHRKLNPPVNFVWHSWEALDDDSVMLTGCTSSGLVTKGKRKGRPKYDGEDKRVVVTLAEERAEEERFERETGKCAECGGDGLVFAKWDHLTGTEYRECRKCKGLGSTRTSGAVDPHAVSTGTPSTRV